LGHSDVLESALSVLNLVIHLDNWNELGARVHIRVALRQLSEMARSLPREIPRRDAAILMDFARYLERAGNPQQAADLQAAIESNGTDDIGQPTAISLKVPSVGLAESAMKAWSGAIFNVALSPSNTSPA
jgi:hypothetical protein